MPKHGWLRFNNVNNGSCPICGNRNTRCAQSLSTGLFHCKTMQDGDTVIGYHQPKEKTTEVGCTLWKEGDKFRKYTDEEKAEWAAKQRQQYKDLENEKVRRKAKAATTQDIDTEYQVAFDRYGISEAHRQLFIDRGLSGADILRIGAYTQGDRLILPVRGLDKKRSGAQIKQIGVGGYIWDRAGNNRTKIHDELPIAVWGNRENPERIIFVEGVTFKPYITSQQFESDLVVGVSGANFAGSRLQIAEVLAKYPGVPLVLMPDGGMTFNSNIRRSYIGLYEVLANELGNEANDRFSVGWWKQHDKSDGDIDEIEQCKIDRIDYIAWSKYLHKMNVGCHYTRLNKTNKLSSELRNERYLSALPLPTDSSLMIVSSPMGTGKTEQLKSLCERWESTHQDGRIILISYRNGLLDQTASRLGIESYRMGYGMSDLFIQNANRLAIVSDSCTRLDLSAIPTGSLIILDEAESVLDHVAGGGTTKGRTVDVQAHFSAILKHTIATGGSIVALQDNITDITIDGLTQLIDRPGLVTTIVKNTYQRFNWEVSIGDGSLVDFSNLIVARLTAGERLMVPTSSATFGKKLERLVVQKLPELASRVERIDRDTAPKLRALISNPVEYLRSNNTQLLIASPTVESGFSVDDRGIDPLFDRVMAYFVNLDTRTHLQMLGRYRSDCPREIFIKQQGCDINNKLESSADRELNRLRNLANTTALRQGYGQINNNSVGETWNDLGSKFTVRRELSRRNAYEFLRCELIACGHNVVAVDWQSVAVAYRQGHEIELDETIKASYAQIQEDLYDEDADALANANGTNMTPLAATIVLSRTDATEEQRVVARKALLHDRLPKMDLTRDFIREVVVVDRERFIRQCELAYMLDIPELSWAIDRIKLAEKIEGAHILYSKMSNCEQKYDLFAPIWERINRLQTLDSYDFTNEDVIAIAAHCRSARKEIKHLFGIDCGSEYLDTKGRKCNTDMRILSKILPLVGKQLNPVGQRGTGKARISIYSIKDRFGYREAINEAFTLKHVDTINKARSITNEHLRSKQTNFNSRSKPILKATCLPSNLAPTESMERITREQLKESDRQFICDCLELAHTDEVYIKNLKGIYTIDAIEYCALSLPDRVKNRIQIA